MYNTSAAFNKQGAKPGTGAGSRPGNSTRMGTSQGTRAIGSAATRAGDPFSSGGPGSMAGRGHHGRT